MTKKILWFVTTLVVWGLSVLVMMLLLGVEVNWRSAFLCVWVAFIENQPPSSWFNQFFKNKPKNFLPKKGDF